MRRVLTTDDLLSVAQCQLDGIVATLRGARNIDSSSNEFLVSGQGVFEVVDLSTKLWAQNAAAGSITIPFANALIVEQIGPAS